MPKYFPDCLPSHKFSSNTVMSIEPPRRPGIHSLIHLNGYSGLLTLGNIRL
jgi:hypothetical protein